VIERRSHGEASWFIDDKKNFVAMSDHHHDDRVSVTFAARVGVQESLIEEDSSATFGHRTSGDEDGSAPTSTATTSRIHRSGTR